MGRTMNAILKYALYGLIGGVAAIVILHLVGRPSTQPVSILVGLTVGGAIGGFLKQRREK